MPDNERRTKPARPVWMVIHDDVYFATKAAAREADQTLRAYVMDALRAANARVRAQLAAQNEPEGVEATTD